MHEETLTAHLPLTVPRRASALQALARRLVLDKLARLQSGQLRVSEADRQWQFGAGEPLLQVEVRNPAFWPALAFGGTVGAGESFMAGDWDCEDLTGLVCLLLRNRPAMMDMEGGIARLSAPLRALLHRARRNDRAGSRRNIAAHYDLGNDFYLLWLDETLMYSSAVFERPDMTLAEASTAKLERICRKLALKPGDEVLEIGTGWGGFALHAAGRHGCRVTSLTLSQEQLELARERVAAAGLADRVEVRLCDYRDQQGQFDKLVSIEMVEAVGAEHLETYFRQCGRLLKPAGAMLLQAITIADQRYEAALKEVDFIQKHIFPGGFLPSVTALASAMTRACDLRTVHLEDIGLHYAETLARWRENFLARLDAVRALGFDTRFIRMWHFYLSYCEGGFRERDLGTVQMLLAKPGWRDPVPLGGPLGPLGLGATP
ncbi:MAG TPA: cyclopropane-fatty-acyl-phospholipid synthase family protein [Chromatiaceae bacterium]|nr:cyclopropane-fatty-acyl-phospholipid synthase family protein [Chromatiaceae bacterium]